MSVSPGKSKRQDVFTYSDQLLLYCVHKRLFSAELISESTLTIFRVTSHDYGKYECRAMNKMGQSTDIIHLDVTSPPDKPTDLEVYNVTHDSVTLMWKRGFDGGLPTSYQIRWRQALDYEDRPLSRCIGRRI